jgi:hypothetical protein
MFFPLKRLKIKNWKSCVEGVFLSFHHFFLVISRGMKGVLVFLFWVINLLFQKVVGQAYYALAHGWRPHPLNDACNAIWWPNLHFHHVIRSTTLSSSCWCSAWRRMMSDLLMVVVSPLFFSLSYIKSSCLLLFFVFQFQSLCFFIFYLHLFSFYNFFYVFNLVIQL